MKPYEKIVFLGPRANGLTFGRLDGLEPGREEAVEHEVIDLGGQVPDPDGGVLLARHQPRRVMVQLPPRRLETNWMLPLFSAIVVMN